VLNNYAYFLSEENRELDKAEQMSKRTIEAEPDNATYLDTYAWILYRQERYEEAMQYMERALAADSVASDVLYEHAGDICYKLGNVERALNYWKQALELQRKAESVEPKLERKVKLKKM
jgi:Tfp pilus assembly protein PilF